MPAPKLPGWNSSSARSGRDDNGSSCVPTTTGLHPCLWLPEMCQPRGDNHCTSNFPSPKTMKCNLRDTCHRHNSRCRQLRCRPNTYSQWYVSNQRKMLHPHGTTQRRKRRTAGATSLHKFRWNCCQVQPRHCLGGFVWSIAARGTVGSTSPRTNDACVKSGKSSKLPSKKTFANEPHLFKN